MYCKNCGNKIEGTDLYCPNCGNKCTQKNVFSQNKKILIALSCVLIVVFILSNSIFLGKKIASYISSNISSAESYNGGDNNLDSYYDDSSNYFYNNDNNFDDSSHENTSNEFNNISVDDYLDIKSKSDLSVVFIGRSSSTFCIQQSINLYAIALKNNLNINYLDISNISSDDYTKLQSSDDYFKGNWGIPLILVVQNGNIVDKVEGVTNINILVEFFTNNGILS